MNRTAIASAAALALLPVLASASITATTAPIVKISPPTGAFPVQAPVAWDELTNVVLNNTWVDLTAAQATQNTGPSTPTTISGVFDSHFFHMEIHNGVPVFGTITFDKPIAAIIFDRYLLDATDAACGAPGTPYPTSLSRSFSSAWYNGGIGISGYSATFLVNTWNPLDPSHLFEFRILTAVPSPGPLTLAGLGTLLVARRRR